MYSVMILWFMMVRKVFVVVESIFCQYFGKISYHFKILILFFYYQNKNNKSVNYSYSFTDANLTVSLVVLQTIDRWQHRATIIHNFTTWTRYCPKNCHGCQLARFGTCWLKTAVQLLCRAQVYQRRQHIRVAALHCYNLGSYLCSKTCVLQLYMLVVVSTRTMQVFVVIQQHERPFEWTSAYCVDNGVVFIIRVVNTSHHVSTSQDILDICQTVDNHVKQTYTDTSR